MTTQTIQNAAHPSWCEPDRCDDLGDDCVRHERVVGRVRIDPEPIVEPSSGELLRGGLKEPGGEISLWSYAFDGHPAADPLVSVVLPDLDGQARCIDLTPTEARSLLAGLRTAVGCPVTRWCLRDGCRGYRRPVWASHKTCPWCGSTLLAADPA